MKHILVIALAGLAAGFTAADQPQLSEREQAALDEALAGRTAGRPVTCVRQQDLFGNRSIGEKLILFNGRGGILWVNNPPAGCPRLDSGRALVTITPTTQLCRGDIVNVVDTVGGFSYGGCGLGDFTPYRRERPGM